MRCAADISCGRSQQLTFLDFEQPPRIEPKPPHLGPFHAVAASPSRSAPGVLSVQGMDAGLESVVLSAQADEGRLLQAARVEIVGAPRVGRATAPLPSRCDLPFDPTTTFNTDVLGQDAQPRGTKVERMTKAQGSRAKPRQAV